MIIKTKRLVIRPLCEGDLLSTHSYAGDLENARYMIFLPNADVGETKAFLDKVGAEWSKEEPSFYEFAVILNGQHIGTVSLYLNEARTEGELGWIIHRDFWGNGYCTEAAAAVKDFARDTIRIKALVAHCDSENTASYRVMEKLGFVYVDGTQQRRNRSADSDSTEYKYVLKF
jgi:RimJ/RimL family protein N-acetyltransferase